MSSIAAVEALHGEDNRMPMVEGVIDYVCPSSSGLVRMKLEEMVAIYVEF